MQLVRERLTAGDYYATLDIFAATSAACSQTRGMIYIITRDNLPTIMSQNVLKFHDVLAFMPTFT